MTSYDGYGSYNVVVDPTVITIPGTTGNSVCDAALSAYITAINAQSVIIAANATVSAAYNAAYADWNNQTGVYTHPGAFWLDGQNGTADVCGSQSVDTYTSSSDVLAKCQAGAKAMGCLYYQDYTCTNADSTPDTNCFGYDASTARYYKRPQCSWSTQTQYQLIKPSAPSTHFLPVPEVGGTIQCCSQTINIGSVDASTISAIENKCSLQSTTTNTTTNSTVTNIYNAAVTEVNNVINYIKLYPILIFVGVTVLLIVIILLL